MNEIAKKEDVRVTKSRKALKKALLKLLENKPFDKINVCEICELAKINRMTFYNHYNDKYALFVDALSDIKNTILYRYKRETVILDLRKKSDCILHLFKIICEVSYEKRKTEKRISMD